MALITEDISQSSQLIAAEPATLRVLGIQALAFIACPCDPGASARDQCLATILTITATNSHRAVALRASGQVVKYYLVLLSEHPPLHECPDG